jgi:hypothetical protein
MMHVSTSAIKPIFAIFWDFDGVGQVIESELVHRKVWISYLAGSPTDCVSGIYPMKSDWH